jgi:hypothetical protein
VKKKFKHLEFIQNIITRMNSNSFQIKGLCITIVSALLAIYCSKKNIHLIVVALFPLLVFWLLDTYYLTQERRFRGLYNDIIKKGSKVKDFDINISKYQNRDYSYWKVLFSKTICPLYVIPIILILILYIFKIF